MKRYIIILSVLLVAFVLAGCRSTSISGQLVSKLISKPGIVTVEPKNRARNVALDSQIVVKFDQEMDASALNNRNISILYIEDLGFNVNPFLESKFEFNKEDKVLTITPPQNFLPNQEVRVVLRESITDANGNEISFGEFKFKTAAE
jgi:uncharacterized protein YcfL